MYYHGARYYIPWLGRWCVSEPLLGRWCASEPLLSATYSFLKGRIGEDDDLIFESNYFIVLLIHQQIVEMENINEENLKNSATRALSSNSLPHIISIYITVIQEVLIMYVQIKEELSEDEKDVYYSIAGEICGDFVGIDKSSVNFILDNGDNFPDEKDGILIYISSEE